MHFTCRSFIGKPEATTWSQYWENEPDDLSLVSRLGHLFGLISFTGPQNSESQSQLGHQFIEDLSQKYFSPDALDIPHQLKKVIDQFVSSNPNLTGISLILAVVYQQNLYLASYRTGVVVICRSSKISQILNGDIDKITQVSGKIKQGDRILLISQSFFDQLTWSKIKQLLSSPDVSEIEENFISSLYSLNQSANLAAAFIQVHFDDEELLSQPEEITPPPLQTETPPPASIPTPHPFTPPSLPKFNFIKKLLPPKKGIIVDNYQPHQLNKRKRLNLVIALLLLFALFASVYIGYRKNSAARVETKYQELKSQVDKKLTDANAIKNLKLESALQLGNEAQKILVQMETLNVHSEEVKKISSDIKSLLSQTGSSSDYTPQKFYDTSLITDNPRYRKMVLSDSSLILMDTVSGRLDILDISQKSTKNLLRSDLLKQAINLVAASKPYFYTSTQLYLVQNDKAESQIDFGDIDQSVTMLDAQSWNGAIYFLDSQNQTIWKYNPNSSGFGSAQNWIPDGETLDSSPTSLAINGRIWVLTQSGRISPYNRGVQESYQTPIDTQLTSANNLVTGLDNEILAFTEGENIVYIINKNGKAHAKYNLGDKKILDIILDETSQAIYVLCDDQKIYKIDY